MFVILLKDSNTLCAAHKSSTLHAFTGRTQFVWNLIVSSIRLYCCFRSQVNFFCSLSWVGVGVPHLFNWVWVICTLFYAYNASAMCTQAPSVVQEKRQRAEPCSALGSMSQRCVFERRSIDRQIRIRGLSATVL